MAKLIKSTKGATAVEFALISLLLFTILFGIFEGGRVFHGWLVITNEAREGARWGAVRVGDPAFATPAVLKAAIEAHVLDRTAGSVDLSTFDVNDTVYAAPDSPEVKVRIDYTIETVTPLISALWPNFPLVAESVMRSE